MKKNTTCSIAGCDKPSWARSFCGTHYRRWSRHGDPTFVEKARHATPEEAFEWYTIPEPTTGCILWIGTTARGGYGSMMAGGQRVASHRYAWEREHGPIPEDLFINHRCWTPQCVNTEHLEPVTRTQNGSYRKGQQSNKSTDAGRGIYPKRLADGSIRYDIQFRRKHYGRFSSLEEARAEIDRVRKASMGDHAGRG